MKKTLIAVVLGCAAILAARDIKDNLERAVIGADMIPGWQINKSGKAADYGKGKIIVGHEADEKALQLNAPADRTLSIYMQSSTPVTVGEYLEFSADVKGKGMVTISYYTYNAKDQYIGDVKTQSQSFTLTENLKEIKCKLKIMPSKSTSLGRIRPCIVVSKGGELVIEDIDIEIDND